MYSQPAPIDHLYLIFNARFFRSSSLSRGSVWHRPSPFPFFLFFFLRNRRPPRSPLFPSPTLSRSPAAHLGGHAGEAAQHHDEAQQAHYFDVWGGSAVTAAASPTTRPAGLPAMVVTMPSSISSY